MNGWRERMSNYEFQLYLHWFRVLRIVRASARWSDAHLRSVGRRVPRILRWLLSVMFTPLALSFEVYLAAWTRLDRRAQARGGVPLRSWHRALFCLTLSLTVWHALLLLGTGWALSTWTVGFCVVHGLVIFALWKRGVRWGRQILGVRPVRPKNPAHAYDNLDFGT